MSLYLFIYFFKRLRWPEGQRLAGSNKRRYAIARQICFFFGLEGGDMNKVSKGQRGKACQPLKGPIGFNLPTWTTVGDQITSNRMPSQTQWAHCTGLALKNVFKESRGRF